MRPPQLDLALDALLLFSGVVTTVPLYCFGEAARRLPLTVLGFMQFLSPTIALLVAVARLGETFGPEMQRSFAFIWAALVLFTWSMVRRAERTGRRVEIVESAPISKNKRWIVVNPAAAADASSAE